MKPLKMLPLLGDVICNRLGLYRDQLHVYAHPPLAERLAPTHPEELVGAPMVRYAVRPEEPELHGPRREMFRLAARIRARVTTGGTHIASVSLALALGSFRAG